MRIFCISGKVWWINDDILVLFNMMSVSGWGAGSSEIDMDNIRLCDWITTEVSLILLEEFPSIIGHITYRLIFKFEEWNAAFQTEEETV